MTQPSDRPFDIVTCADLCVDLVVSGGEVVPRFGQIEQMVGAYAVEMGGSCSIFACQAAKLGLRVALVGRVGDDDFGRLILRRLAACGVETQFVAVDPTLTTGLTVALCTPDDRAMLTYPGSIAAVRPEDLPDMLLAQARHLHHGSYFLQTGLRAAMPDIFRRARALGLTTSLDTNWDPVERWEGVADLLPFIDIFMPNEQEARAIARAATTEAATEWLRERVPLLALKRGGDGALLTHGAATLTRTLPPPESPGDGIGAGDSFDAGFLAGWLRGLSLDRCLTIAAVCGRAVAGATGGLAGQPRWDEVREV